MRTERELLLDCVRRLNASKLPYMVTGALASIAWGQPRTTHDVDVVMQYGPADVATVVQAFTPGFFIQELSVRNALKPPYQFNALDELSPLKVDVWLLRNEPIEREMFRRRKVIDLHGEPMVVASPEDTILSKLRWWKISPSDRQLDDCAGIIAVQGNDLDLTYLRHWANESGVDDTLERILSGEIGPKTT
jgi:hypothetical protein